MTELHRAIIEQLFEQFKLILKAILSEANTSIMADYVASVRRRRRSWRQRRTKARQKDRTTMALNIHA